MRDANWCMVATQFSVGMQLTALSTSPRLKLAKIERSTMSGLQYPEAVPFHPECLMPRSPVFSLFSVGAFRSALGVAAAAVLLSAAASTSARAAD